MRWVTPTVMRVGVDERWRSWTLQDGLPKETDNTQYPTVTTLSWSPSTLYHLYIKSAEYVVHPGETTYGLRWRASGVPKLETTGCHLWTGSHVGRTERQRHNKGVGGYPWRTLTEDVVDVRDFKIRIPKEDSPRVGCILWSIDRDVSTRR